MGFFVSERAIPMKPPFDISGDLDTPVSAFLKLQAFQPSFLLESVEHGERWSRFSFVGRNPLATLVLRNGLVDVEGELPEAMPRNRGILAAIEWLLSAYRSPSLETLPPLHGGVVGCLGYDVVLRQRDHHPV